MCSLFKVLLNRCFKLWYFGDKKWLFYSARHWLSDVTNNIIQYIAKCKIDVRKKSLITFQWFQKNPNPWVHRLVGNWASLVSKWNGWPLGWFFSVPTEHQKWILFILHDHVTAFLQRQSENIHFFHKKGYSKNQYIAPKYHKDNKQGLASLTDVSESWFKHILFKLICTW